MFLIIDLEATCSEDLEITAADMEIIEVGAVWAHPNGEVVNTFQTFVRPTLNKLLTSYCINLTGISQNDVNDADLWPDVSKQLTSFATLHAPNRLIWGSWGQYDFKQIERDCLRHDLINPLLNWEHINLKREFARSRKIKEVGMRKALEMTGLPLLGSHHRGLDDAINIAHLLPKIELAKNF